MKLYKTVRQEASVSQTIEKSKFISHITPVQNREEAEAFITSIRGQYRDATHNVPAMILGQQGQIQWASDDGEPQGTSGAPMMQLMSGEGLTNLVIVVTRYFGGIKLGTGGLARAYSSSARLAIEEAGVCYVCSVCSLTAQIEYSYLDRLQKMSVPQLDTPGAFLIADTQYAQHVTVQIHCQEEDEETVCSRLANLTSGGARITDRRTMLRRV